MPAGRPKIPIDYNLVEKLAGIQCTQQEIASIIGVHVDTLQRDAEFCTIYKKAAEDRKASLRRMQWAAAETGNITMQIWLGKQYLNQSDKRDNAHSGGLSITFVEPGAGGKDIEDRSGGEAQ